MPFGVTEPHIDRGRISKEADVAGRRPNVVCRGKYVLAQLIEKHTQRPR
jgi:hypothetical protein